MILFIISLFVGLVSLFTGIWIGFRIQRERHIQASEERAVRIVEHWIHKIQDQKFRNTIDNSYDAQIIEWTIEQCIENEDYEEASRLQKILDKLKGDN